MKRKTVNQKQSNKGFTLVEVLVAILILAIIVVPLLSAFVMSAKTNAKARQTLRATTLAQNVMEELKAYSLETSAGHHNGTETGNFVVAAATQKYETVRYADGVHKVVTAVKDASTGEVTVTGREEEQYDFVLRGVKQENAEFDVEISVRKPEEKDANIPDGLGSFDMVNITSMNRSDCAYFAQEEAAHSVVATEYVRRSQLNHTPMTAETFQSRMTRTIKIDVNSAADGSETVMVTYNYMIPDEGYVTPDHRLYTEYTTVFDNYASQEELKSVYLYYYPLYGLSGALPRDTFEINNMSDLGINVYLIKMKDVTYNVYDDNNYKPSIKVTESNAQADDTGDVSNVKLCTNISNPVLQYTAAGTTPQFRVTDLGNAETVQNLYDVTIQVYKHDAVTEGNDAGVTTLKFDEGKKIATFTGTVLDKAD